MKLHFNEVFDAEAAEGQQAVMLAVTEQAVQAMELDKVSDKKVWNYFTETVLPLEKVWRAPGYFDKVVEKAQRQYTDEDTRVSKTHNL